MFLCFTDLDGTLLNHDDYRYDAAIPTLRRLQGQGIPVIPTTSKTKAEVIDLRKALGLTDPFIVENGSGIFLETADTRFDFQALAETESLTLSTIDGFNQVTLGVSYAEARQGLKALAQQIGEPLQGFGDLTLGELQATTQLPIADIQQACDRQFSEPFLRPQAPLSTLTAIVEEQGFKILVGNRFCHLLGAGSAKGRAVKLLTQAWQWIHPQQSITTIGLGDSPNDLSLLAAVDIAIVVPGVKGVHPDLIAPVEQQGWQVAPVMGCVGWAEVVEKVIPRPNL